MSWLNPYKHFQHFACKVKPHGKICEDHLRAEHPECFRSHSTYLLLELPQKAWRKIFQGSHCPIHHSRECCDLMNESSILGCAFKILLLLAVSIGILYAVVKVAAQRRASIQ